MKTSTFVLGTVRQPQEFWQEQVILTSLDPHTKWLHRIGAYEHDKVSNIVSQREAEIAATVAMLHHVPYACRLGRNIKLGIIFSLL